MIEYLRGVCVERFRYIGWFVVVLVGVLGVSAAAEPQVGQMGVLTEQAGDLFLQQLRNSLQDVTSVRVEFRQERQLAILEEPVISRGYLVFSRPGRLHWEWTHPYGSLLVLRGDEIARFDVVDKHVRKIQPVGEEIQRAIAREIGHWFQGNFSDSSGLFSIDVMDGPKRHLIMRPRGHGLDRILKQIDVELSGDKLRIVRLSMIAPNGDRTVVSFFKEVRNLKLSDSLFDLEHPSLVKGPLQKHVDSSKPR